MKGKFYDKKKMLKIGGIAMAGVVAISGIVTAGVLLGGKSDVPIDAPIENPPVETPTDPVTPDVVDPTPTVQTVGMPLETYELATPHNKNALIYFPSLRIWQTHIGTDFKAELGTNVLSVLDGTVESVGSDPLDGNFVVVKHSDNRTTYYKSLDAVNVKKGDAVTKGFVLGTVGNTMKIESHLGPHLHFEMTVDSETVNPADFLTELGGK